VNVHRTGLRVPLAAKAITVVHEERGAGTETGLAAAS
jgi:hypothetical protein